VEGEAVEPLTGAPEEEVPASGAPTVEARVAEPSLVEAPAPEAPAVEGPVPLGGWAPMTVDLTLDDTPLDKGKQVMGVEGGEAADQAGASTTIGEAGTAGEAGPFTGPGDAPFRLSSSWPDIAALARAWAKAEIPRWGAVPPVQGRREPCAEPVFVLNDKDEVHQWEYLEGVRQHLDRLLGVASKACGVRGMPPRYDRPIIFLWFSWCLFPSAF
jgi:hypothetical protein